MTRFKPDHERMKLVDEDGEIEDIPCVYEVCDDCMGRGTHDPPHLRRGFTMEEMDEYYGPDVYEDFVEPYMSGKFDVVCETCKGMRVVLSPDEDRMTEEQLEVFQEAIRAEYEYAMELDAERRYFGY